MSAIHDLDRIRKRFLGGRSIIATSVAGDSGQAQAIRSTPLGSAVPSVCLGAAASGKLSKRLGRLRAASAHALAQFDFGAQAGNRPGQPVGQRLSGQRRDHTRRRFAPHRRLPRRNAHLQRCRTAFAEIAALQPNRVLPQGERLGDPCTGPAGNRQSGAPRSASPGSRDPARSVSAPCCSSLAATGDLTRADGRALESLELNLVLPGDSNGERSFINSGIQSNCIDFIKDQLCWPDYCEFAEQRPRPSAAASESPHRSGEGDASRDARGRHR